MLLTYVAPTANLYKLSLVKQALCAAVQVKHASLGAMVLQIHLPGPVFNAYSMPNMNSYSLL